MANICLNKYQSVGSNQKKSGKIKFATKGKLYERKKSLKNYKVLVTTKR